MKIVIKGKREVIELPLRKSVRAARILRFIESEKCIPSFSLVLVRDNKPITSFHSINPNDEVEVYEVGSTG